MRILYLDCFSGIAGDMLLGALIDLGADFQDLRRRLKGLPLEGYSLSAKRTVRQGISATKFDVNVRGHHHHRGWKEIRGIVGDADLPGQVKDKALKIFKRLIEAEARIHGIPLQKVHLHEVGAVDAIVDVVGSVLALDNLLGARGQLHVSPLHLGGGKIEMAHGTYPVPPPATVELLEGVPVVGGPVAGELVTPTGAAIVSTLASSFGPMPPMTLAAVGYGAGSRSYEGHPNVLRAILGESPGRPGAGDQVVVMECTIDDMNPQAYGFLMDRLFRDGAHEVFYTPVQMKKSRPGVLVTVVAPQARFGELAAAIFEETTTIGLRHRITDRIELDREMIPVQTPFGRVMVKVSSWRGGPVQAQPEYDDCRRIAESRRVPLKEIQAAALAAYRAGLPPAGVSAPGGSASAAGRPAGRRDEPRRARPVKPSRRTDSRQKAAAGKAAPEKGARQKAARGKTAGRKPARRKTAVAAKGRRRS